MSISKLTVFETIILNRDQNQKYRKTGNQNRNWNRKNFFGFKLKFIILTIFSSSKISDARIWS